MLAQRLGCDVFTIERTYRDSPDEILRELKVMKIEATYRPTNSPTLD